MKNYLTFFQILNQKIRQRFSDRKKITKVLAIAVVAVLLISSLVKFLPMFFKPESVQAAWMDNAWQYRSLITIDHTKVGSGGVTNYPILLTGANMPAGLWANAKADGSDLRVTSSDGTTEINFELVSFTPGSSTMELWVLGASVSSAADWTGYLYWGNAGASAKAASWGQGVWSTANYAGDYHLPNGTSLTANDSTGNANNLTISGPTAVAGKVDGGANVDGSDDYLYNNTAYDYTTQNFSFSFWVYPHSLTVGTFFYKGQWHANGYYSATGATGAITFNTNQSGATQTTATSDGAIAINNWYHIEITRSGANVKIYVNGADVTSSAGAHVNPVSSSDPFRAGGYMPGTAWANLLDGVMDEFRVRTTVSTPADAATEYNNESSPGTFYSMGAAEQKDTIAPSNPTAFSGYSTSGKTTQIYTNGYHTYPTPYFEWPAAEAAGGAHDTGEVETSGVAGYYSYFGTSCGGGGANPQTTRGNLSDTGGGVHYSADTNLTVTDLGASGGVYCLRMKTKDNAGNISDTSEVFIYNYDLNNPNPPAYIAANPAGYTTTNSFTFSWPVATDDATVPSSGIAGYQYKTGQDGAAWSSTQVETSKSAIASYQNGVNIFYVRSVDVAGNVSAAVQTAYYYSASAPTKPTALTAVPDLSDSNAFAFTWTAPIHNLDIVDYGYSINASPTNNNLIWTGSATASLPADAYATIQGSNTLYLVAKDEAGNYALDAANVAQVNFVCQTPAPPIPLFSSITDSSSRPNNLYALTLNWSAGVGQNPASFDHYSIERSTDNSTFAQIATSTSTFYVDSGLTADTTYYYRLRSVDNAASASAASSTLSRKATGKYTSAPALLREPTVISVKATEATINWVTDRASTSLVKFGTSEMDLSESKGQLEAVTDHTVTITSLKPSTRYFFQTQSLDELRDYPIDSANSATYNLTTLAAPSISGVTTSNITLTSADITYETTNASTTRLDYGKGLSYGLAYIDTSGSYTTRHTIKLTDLDDSSTYHFKLYGVDTDGNSLISDDYVFDTLPRPKISNLGYQADISGPTFIMKVSWQTNVPTSSSAIVTINGAEKEVSNSEMTTNHEVAISNLDNDKIYQFYVSGSDQFGNLAKSDLSQMQTPLDTRPPSISNVTIETSNVGFNREDKAQVMVSWETDEPATSQVEFGEGLNGNQYTGKTVEDKALVNKHLVVISDLVPSRPYHLRVVSSDKAKNTSRSSDSTAIIGEVPKSILQLILKTLDGVFGWLGGLKGLTF